jgi:drug/metabolite transporter (DMT)-like permease
MAMVLCGFFFSLMSLLVKALGTRMPSQEVVFARAVVSMVVAYVLVRRARPGNWGHRKGLLFVRGMAGFAALSCFFYALIHLPLADATVIQYTSPVFTAWLGWLVLAEALTLAEAVLSGAGLLGVLLIARPTFIFGGEMRLDAFATLIGLLGAALSAVAYVSVRKLGKTEHPMIIVFWFTVVTVPASLPGMLVAGVVVPTATEVVLLAGVGVTAVLGRATAIGYVQIVFAATWGMIFFHENPDALSLLGAALVLVSVVTLARRRGTPEVRAVRAEEGTAEAL